MNCINCNLEISPSFVASIRDNKCPACGKSCLSEADHGAIFSVVSIITSAVTDLSEDMTVRLATALHGKFDIFPKGVVVDGQVTKEVVYVSSNSPSMRKLHCLSATRAPHQKLSFLVKSSRRPS